MNRQIGASDGLNPAPSFAPDEKVTVFKAIDRTGCKNFRG
jgi:hypothetical protein